MGYCVGMDYVKGKYVGTSFNTVKNKEENIEENKENIENKENKENIENKENKENIENKEKNKK